MRFNSENNGVSVHVIAGTYVVMLAFDTAPKAADGLLGFAIHRTDHTEGEEYWLQGMRTFESVYPNPPEGALMSTHEYPIQDFLWSDFTAKPGHEYTYSVLPVKGKPKRLEYGEPVNISIRTETETNECHSIWFNRGVIGSQAYAHEFNNQDPQKLTGAEKERAYAWLSRGLCEAMTAFIREAESEDYALRAAVYEFSYEPIVKEFGDAQEKCKDVRIIYDARIKQVKGEDDEEAAQRVAMAESLLKKSGLLEMATARAENPNVIAHNKFVVLLKKNEPIAVWTGSTNFTESGIFGQSNVGHAVRDKDVATAYLNYWERLSKDPKVPDLREQNEEADPDLKEVPPPTGTTPIFSPRTKNAIKETMLNWYASLMGSAKSLLCFTAAFGVNELFLKILELEEKNDDDLRLLFLNTWGVKKDLAQATRDRLQQNRNNLVAVGGYLSGDVLQKYLEDRWRKERSNSLSGRIKYTHTKFMLIDPLGDDPVVVSGSANFSDASTINNDENMIIIRGDTRVADIYLGEFMRLWQHYRFRSIVNATTDELGVTHGYKPNYLCETDDWTSEFFQESNLKFKRRVTFAKLIT